MRWKIYYDSGADYSSDDGPWEQAPADGVLFVAVWENGAKRVLSGNDFYIAHDGMIAETQDVGPLLRKLGVVKFGRWSSHRTMEAAAARVRADL